MEGAKCALRQGISRSIYSAGYIVKWGSADSTGSRRGESPSAYPNLVGGINVNRSRS